MSESNMESIVSLANLVMIDITKAKFKSEAGGYLSLDYDGTEYKKIKLNRALPYRSPEDYICVSDKEGKEIGILKSLKELDSEQRKLLTDELEHLYYCPTITKVISTKEKMGFMYFDVVTNAGKRKFSVRDATKNIRLINPEDYKKVQILDVDGNRYIIEDYTKLGTSQSKVIESFLV